MAECVIKAVPKPKTGRNVAGEFANIRIIFADGNSAGMFSAGGYGMRSMLVQVEKLGARLEGKGDRNGALLLTTRPFYIAGARHAWVPIKRFTNAYIVARVTFVLVCTG
jgi:hypothetical protein